MNVKISDLPEAAVDGDYNNFYCPVVEGGTTKKLRLTDVRNARNAQSMAMMTMLKFGKFGVGADAAFLVTERFMLKKAYGGPWFASFDGEEFGCNPRTQLIWLPPIDISTCNDYKNRGTFKYCANFERLECLTVNNTAPQDWHEAFIGCTNLKYVKIDGLNSVVDLSDTKVGTAEAAASAMGADTIQGIIDTALCADESGTGEGVIILSRAGFINLAFSMISSPTAELIIINGKGYVWLSSLDYPGKVVCKNE